MKRNEIQRSKNEFAAKAQAGRRINTFYLLLAVIAAMALVTLWASVHYARAASPTASGYWPVCVTVGHGTRIEFPQTKRGYAERIKRGAHPARFKAGQWVCSYTGKGAK